MNRVINRQNSNQDRVEDGLDKQLLLQYTSLFLCEGVHFPVRVPGDCRVESPIQREDADQGEDYGQNHDVEKDKLLTFVLVVGEVAAEENALPSRLDKVCLGAAEQLEALWGSVCTPLSRAR